jgi:hypothetical protein
MPNWVYNTLTISGDAKDVKRFVEQARGEYEMWGETRREELSFWNFAKPHDPESEFYKNNWYDWNLKNWGTKWDAANVYAEEQPPDTEQYYDFDTAWGPPVEAFQTMVKQYPTLQLKLRYEEEQGWGGEYESINGEAILTDEWDIPDSHEEVMERKQYCKCEEMRDDEAEWMYDDCPRKKELTNA